jgi:hypothetical protein
LLAILESQAKIAKLKTVGTVVSFVSGSPIPGYAASVAISELFDMALADMFDAIGDVDMKTAIRALNDAQRDPTKEGKHRHRMTAETCLRGAYEKFQSSINTRKEKWANRKLGYGDPKIRSEHEKAATAAATIASILKTEALQSGADTWADNAREHFDAFDAMIEKEYKEYADNYDAYENKYRLTRLTPGKWVADAAAVGLGFLVLRRPGPMPNHSAAYSAEADFRKATEARAVMNNLDQARRQFEPLYKQLRSRRGRRAHRVVDVGA